jgi:uncharacterized protein (DUF1778 family)
MSETRKKPVKPQSEQPSPVLAFRLPRADQDALKRLAKALDKSVTDLVIPEIRGLLARARGLVDEQQKEEAKG